MACPRVWRSPWIPTRSSFDQEGSSGKPAQFPLHHLQHHAADQQHQDHHAPQAKRFQRQPCQLTSVVVPERAVLHLPVVEAQMNVEPRDLGQIKPRSSISCTCC